MLNKLYKRLTFLMMLVHYLINFYPTYRIGLNQARQNLRNAFNRNLQQSDEIFSETNPIVAKGNLADTQRLRELKAKLD